VAGQGAPLGNEVYTVRTLDEERADCLTDIGDIGRPDMDSFDRLLITFGPRSLLPRLSLGLGLRLLLELLPLGDLLAPWRCDARTRLL